MAGYEGMRWFKCDLQVQTPEDNTHWGDDDTRLGNPRRPMVPSGGAENGTVGPNIPDEHKIQEAARAYLRRCHEFELEVIGVTDHNFSQQIEPRDWFLTHLVQQNKSVAKNLGRSPLCILPGFEVDIGYHVLCLFDPATKVEQLQELNSILTKLGLAENQRFLNGQPQPLRANGSYVNLKKLLETVQVEYGGIVIAAHADQSDGILNDTRNIGDYRNLDLLAVEVTANPPAKCYLQILDGENEQWSRTDRQPAYVMSSDAKSLKSDGSGIKPTPNSIGYRHTWIRMSKPSTEALRQAFLDPRSRVRVLGDRPSIVQTHPRITSIAIRGATFLADQEIYFSENFNCVIGGRGSGKSSILEYLRFALKMDDVSLEDNETSIGRKRSQLRASITNPDAEVRIQFQAESGVPDTLVYVPSNSPDKKRYIEGRAVDDIQTVLNQLQAQFFSQGELSRITDNGGGQVRVLALIDASSGAELSNLQAEEHELQSRLKTLYQARHEKQRLMDESTLQSKKPQSLSVS